MLCPGCGHDIPDEARFCPYCGSQIRRDTGRQATAPATPEATSIAVPGTDRDRKVERRRIAIIVSMCALALVLVFVLGVNFWGRMASSFDSVKHEVTFRAVTTDLDENSSRIPAVITGTDAEGNDVHMELYLAREGADCELAPGSYHLKVQGSPISSTGLIFDLTVSEIDFEVPSNLGPDEGYLVPTTQTLIFTPIEPAKVTDEEIEEAVEWARKDTDPSVDADALERAARNLRDNPPPIFDTETMPMI